MALHRFLSFSLLLGASAFSASDAQPITSVSEIRALTPDRAAAALPVRITGVVTCCSAPWRVFFISDGAHGVFVNDPPGAEPGAIPCGTRVTVEGITGAGGYLPVIRASRVDFGGAGALPPPVPMNATNLYSPSLDAEWIETDVEVIGLSTRAGGMVLNVRLGGWPMKAFVPVVTPAGKLPWDLVGRRVRMRATAATLFNETRQMTDRLLYVPSLDEIVPEDAVTPPKAAQPIETDELLRVNRERDDLVRVRGTVLYVDPQRCIYLRGARRSIRMDTSRDYGLQTGDVIEADGYVVLSPIRPALNPVSIRHLGSQSPPEARAWDALTRPEPALHHDLVKLQSWVSETGRVGNHTVLLCRCGAGAFEAIVPAAPSEWRVPAPGSMVALTGILNIRIQDPIGFQDLARDFTVQMRSVADVDVIRRPPWWTVAKIAWLLGAVAAVAAAASSWAFLLRRRVRAQTETIRSQIQREAVYRERMRIAGDLHDNLGASITQIGMMSALAEAPAATAGSLRDHMKRIRERSEQVVRALDSAVWAANPEYDSLSSLIDYLCHFMGDLFAELPVRWRIEAPDDVDALPLEPGVRHHLVLSVSEAVNNALKHSGASEVLLRVETQRGEVVVSVEDNGSGFDEPAVRHGNGLRSIRRRMESIGGSAAFLRMPGGGTRVILTAPAAEHLEEPATAHLP